MGSVAIIGAGAAGCFAAAVLKRRSTGTSITIYEEGPRPLVKVSKTGGGRCNLTNTFEGVTDLSKVYPRGTSLMRRLLKGFAPEDTLRWFSEEGVKLHVEEDGRVFPDSEDAMEIVRTLERALSGVTVKTGCRLVSLEKSEDGFSMTFNNGRTERADRVLIASGGAPKGIPFLRGIPTVESVPSLFSLKIDDSALKALMGSSATVLLRLGGFSADGPMLITDWGVSGPAVLKLSSYAARHLAEKGYRENLHVRWCPKMSEEMLRSFLGPSVMSARKLVSTPPEGLSSRIWAMLVERSGLREDIRRGELGRKGLSRLASLLLDDVYPVSGKGPFKEEFVTSGGIDIAAVNPKTLEAKSFPQLYFAGEVLDIDGVTGGYNLQAAWTTGYTAAVAIAEAEKKV